MAVITLIYTGKPVKEDQIKWIMPRYTEQYPKVSNIDHNGDLDTEPSDNDEYDNSDHEFHRFVITVL
jgi:hypothetical protein